MQNKRTTSDVPHLITSAQRGDEAAFTLLYERHVQAAYRLAYGVLLNQQDAEEVVQDSFVYAFQNLRHYDAERSAFATWLYTITMSRCRNRLRRKFFPTTALAEIAEWVAGSDPHPERVVELRSMQDTVLAALKRLSPKLREAVVLRHFQGLTYREIAQVLGCPQKTAESRVRLAHRALFIVLKDQNEIFIKGELRHDLAY